MASLFSLCKSWIVAASNLPKKHTGSFFFSLKQHILSNIWVFIKKQAVAILAGKSSDITVSTSQGNSRYGSQHTQNTLTWHLFSCNGTVCPSCFFTQLWNRKETCFCEHGNWGLMAKAVFSPHESWIDRATKKLPLKYPASLLSSSQQELWSSIYVFWKTLAFCHFLLASHPREQFHQFRVMTVSTHRTPSCDLISHGMV